MSDYDRCVIPVPILNQLREWQAVNLFDAFEIRAQAIYMTAALFGYRDGNMWLLARWSEDQRQLISFSDVKSITKKWFSQERTVQIVFAALFAILGTVCLVILANELSWGMAVMAGIGFAAGIATLYDDAIGPSKELRDSLKCL